jgi:hypothetical protein
MMTARMNEGRIPGFFKMIINNKYRTYPVEALDLAATSGPMDFLQIIFGDSQSRCYFIQSHRTVRVSAVSYSGQIKGCLMWSFHIFMDFIRDGWMLLG